MRLNKTLLARRAELGRTTVSEAFRDGGPVPSAQTVAALSRALDLPVEELLRLQQKAACRSGLSPGTVSTEPLPELRFGRIAHAPAGGSKGD
ncbi:hypothetical protein SUDANB1_00029 [Streptomyces sp. enrichment culture]